MAIFEDHKVGVNDLLGVIPESLLSHLSENTKVDYYSKVLHGKKLFYLLMYGILENDRLSQRTLEDTFNDPVFKMLFNFDQSESVRRSSISERLSKIDSNYFREIYECVYNQFSVSYLSTEKEKYNLIRVDSSMVSQASNSLLVEGIDHKNGKKSVKYSMAFDGMLPYEVKLFTSATHASEDVALPEVIRSQVKHDENHHNIYILDRGVQSASTMKDFAREAIPFIVRAKENRKYIEIESFITETSNVDLGSLELLKDCKVYLYRGVHLTTKKGTKRWKEELFEVPFRLIVARGKDDPGKEFWFITNDFDLSAKEITDAYRRRWDIEVFFCFIKQELNASHLVSLNKNGIERLCRIGTTFFDDLPS
ncbi:IS4 family transposase [Butyricimonas faecihominis]|uniref:IS4 family transposase n=1 Tax=Butyricimonas faecihominis TaxID=1472416 RepID=UPI002670A3B6|nr:IS4 family transposase [Butyricimonas faecihominis]